MAAAKLSSLMAASGRSLTVYEHAAAVPKEKARSVFARLYEAGKAPEALLEIVLAIRALHRAVGPWGAPDWVPIQTAKLVKRLKGVSGTHWQKRGINLPTRYPRSEGGFMVILGEKVIERAAVAIDEAAIGEVLQAVNTRGAP